MTLYDPSVKLFKSIDDNVRQSKYVIIIGTLKHSTYCKHAFILYDSRVKLFGNIDDNVRQSEYASIIGILRYSTDCKRPNIVFTIGLLCKFTTRLSILHCHAIETVIRYLKRTMNLKLHYQKNHVVP